MDIFKIFYKVFSGMDDLASPVETSKLPGSLFQLLEKFVEKLPFEVSVEVTRGLPRNNKRFFDRRLLKSHRLRARIFYALRSFHSHASKLRRH